MVGVKGRVVGHRHGAFREAQSRRVDGMHHGDMKLEMLLPRCKP